MPTLKSPDATASRVTWALWWASRGWKVFPVCWPGMPEHKHSGKVCTKDLGKGPLITWQDCSADPERIREWWQRWPDANIGGTPPQDHFVVDIDGELDAGVEFPITWTHSTGKGTHLLYRQNITKPVGQTGGSSRLWTNVDTRVSGKGYVVLPPSLHVSGRVYTLVDQTSPMVFPAELVPAQRLNAPTKTHAGKHPESDILRLLTLPRDHADLGDEAMSRVAGYLARYVPDVAMYEALLGAINLSLADPLDETALAKKRGIWEKHKANADAQLAKAVDDAARGWLYEMGESGYSTQVGTGDNIDYVSWSNFRVQAKSLMDYGDRQVWVVDFHKSDGSVLADVELPSDVLASTPALRRFLVNRGMSLLAPSNDKRGNHGERLLCLLQSQSYERHTVVDAYGWSQQLEAFVTPDKLIRADSIEETHNITGQRINTKLNYGFGPKDEAISALSEYLTFQDETCMSLLGAWLMVLYLKGQFSGLAPNLAVEAFSGSGKTTYLEMLSEFAGYKKKGGRSTYAVARNEFTVSHNIFCWHDDVTMDDRLQELFRAAATGGAYELTDMSKQDNSTKVIELRASMVVSAEHIKFLDQKAMTDRFLKIEFPSPSGRRSRLDPTKDQWHDVKAFKTKYKDNLTQFAGTLVQLALGHASMLDQLPELTIDTSRFGQQVALMRVGARVLSAITDDENHTKRVDAWAESLVYSGAASYVVRTVAPITWMNMGQPTTRGNMMPVFLNPDDELFYICPEKLAEYWHQQRKGNGDRNLELSTADAIRTELKACGVDVKSKKEVKRWPCERTNGSKEWGTWYRVPRQYTEMIYRIATGSPRDMEGEE